MFYWLFNPGLRIRVDLVRDLWNLWANKICLILFTFRKKLMWFIYEYCIITLDNKYCKKIKFQRDLNICAHIGSWFVSNQILNTRPEFDQIWKPTTDPDSILFSNLIRIRPNHPRPEFTTLKHDPLIWNLQIHDDSAC